ncbi:MAG: hypothetical protein JW891_02305 [Candidatus Lokiarchaeota archaeon]|nr:hypothetical protein [Candidatus Lokiarchaeota archaeon]
MPPIRDDEELTIAYYLLTRDIKNGEKILSFSRLLWPFASVPGTISTHILLDGLAILSKKGKLSNPPRQPLIGHLLRDTGTKTEKDQLQQIINIITYKDVDAEIISESEDSEFQSLEIEGLLSPDFLKTIVEMLPTIKIEPVSNYMPLNVKLSTEMAIDIAEKYRKTFEQMKGNALRWKNQIELISKFVDKKLLDLKVNLSDVKQRFSSQLKKTSSLIDDSQVEIQKDYKGDEIENWRVEEKKKIIESVSTLFLTVERNLEDMIKKNKFFTRDESLKSKVFEDLQPKFLVHFNYLKEQGTRLLESINNLSQKYEDILEKAKAVDERASQKLKEHEIDLQTRLQDRNHQITTIEKEQESAVIEITSYRDDLEALYKQITEIIVQKHNTCLIEAEELKQWSIPDNKSDFFAMPIRWMYMPLYAMFIEDEEMMEERISIVFPGRIGDSSSIYEIFSSPLQDFQAILVNKIEDDMILRSNFEFCCENKNLSKDPNIKKRLMKGISSLRYLDLLTTDTEKKMRNSLGLLP